MLFRKKCTTKNKIWIRYVKNMNKIFHICKLSRRLFHTHGLLLPIKSRISKEEINFLCWTIFEFSKRIILFQKSIDIQLNYIRMGITYNWILNINYFESCFNKIIVKTCSDLFLPRFFFGLLQIHLSDEKEKASHFSSSLISKIVSQGFGLISHYF